MGMSINPNSATVPKGSIMIWSGALSTIPYGWRQCDGTNGTLDLRGRMVRGVDAIYTYNVTGGAEYWGGSTDYSITGISCNGHTHGSSATGQFGTDFSAVTSADIGYEDLVDPSHTHSFTVDTIPPFRALYYIQKM